MATVPPQQQVFPFTSLPAEIRNLIMEYALVPGDVYPYSDTTIKEPKPSSTSSKLLRAVFKRPSSSSSSSPSPSSSTAHLKIKLLQPTRPFAPPPSTTETETENRPPAFQLLKTCRSIYSDGHAIFYSQNTFHLPSGSAEDLQTWLSHGFRPEQRRLVRSVCLSLSLQDLTPRVLKEMERKWLFDIEVRSKAEERRMVDEVAYALCWRYWRDKVEWVKGWEGLERVELRCAKAAAAAAAGGGVEERVVFERGEWRGSEGEKKGMVESGLLEAAREGVRAELGSLVQEVGWKVARKAFLNRRVRWRGGSGVLYM